MTPLRLWLVALVGCTASSLVFGATPAAVIYRCPGNVISNELDARQAKQMGCQRLALANVTVLPVQTLPALPAAAASAALPAPAAKVPTAFSVAPGGTTAPASASSRASIRVPAIEQRSRDSDAFTILSSELKHEQAKLASLRQHPASAESNAAMARSVANIAALERELARHPVKTLR
jgi:hypothetical protein